MKKIININLSGRVIPIEDSAYEKLQAYIESLRRYFAHEDGRDEIINDIESRIAELMNDSVRKGAAAITDADITQIISTMGSVEDFEAAEKETAAESTGAMPMAEEPGLSQARERKRLYRDSGDKILGGVCSGLANYLNVDPSIIRILFAIITFGGFGFGILAYIFLWIVLPPKDLEGFTGKKLYRNPDDRVFGGVAGGLAAYFNTRSRNIRLIFAAPLLLSILIGIIRGLDMHFGSGFAWNIGFGSLTGSFILIYIILWMVLPEAGTVYEKMEMRGEKVDVNRIYQNVKEGMDSMKDKVKDWGSEVKTSAQEFGQKAKEFAGTRGKAFASDVQETVRRRGGFGHVIGVLFKVFFLFIAGTIAFGLFVAFIALLVGGVAWWPINDYLWTSKWQQLYAWGTLIFFLGVPLIAFITWLVRRILRVRSRSNYLGWTFGALWTFGWVCAVLFASSIASDFRYYDHYDTPMTMTQPKGKMIVSVSQPVLEYDGNFGWISRGGEGWNLTNDTLKLSTVKFRVIASTDSLYHVNLKRYSFGRTVNEALSRAEKIQYTAFFRDSVLDLGNGYSIDRSSKFRGQQVEIEILVPVGRKIRFDRSVIDKLNPVNIRVRDRRHRGMDIVIDDENNRFRFRPDVDYTMDIDGELKDSTGAKATSPSDNDYRYPGADSTVNNNNTDDIQKQIDAEKRKKEESERKIKELEDRKKTPAPNTGINPPAGSNTEKNFAIGPSPVSAVSQWF